MIIMNLRVCLIIATAFIGLSFAFSGQSDEATERWKKIYTTIFNYHPTALKPEETLERLKLLDNLFPSVKIPEIKANSWNYDKNLIKLADISPDRCSLQFFNEFTSFAMLHYHEKSILSFVEYYKGEQFAACRPRAYQELEEAVNRIGAKDQKNVVKFVDEVLKYNQTRVNKWGRKKVKPTFNGLTRGSLDFLTMKDPQLSKETPKAELNKIFAKSIVSSCAIAVGLVRNSLKFYNLLLDTVEEQVDRTLEQLVIDWMTRYKVCKKLVKDQNYILGVAHEVLLEKRKKNEVLLDPREVLRREEDAKERKIYERHLKAVRRNRDYHGNGSGNGGGFGFWKLFFLRPF